jgi:carboxymethylenebutenolidase
MSVETAVPYFTAKPSGPTEGRAGLVVVMEGNGISQQLLRVCQRFAAEGFVVAAPDLFHRFGGSDADRAAADGWYGKLRPEDGLADVAAAAAELRSVGVASVGITGFCMGGMFTLKAAGTGRFHRAVAFYGMLRVPDHWRGEGTIEPLDAVAAPGACPAMAIVGTLDQWTPPDDVAAAEAAGVVVVPYEGADHGFVHDDSRPAHRPADAADAWRRAIDFLSA